MGKMFVDEGYCKGCGLCVEACPLKIVAMDKERLTSKGYHPACCINMDACTLCKSCAIMCPECAITVER